MIIILLTLIACTDNQRTKVFGGEMNIPVPCDLEGREPLVRHPACRSGLAAREEGLHRVLVLRPGGGTGGPHRVPLQWVTRAGDAACCMI